MIISFKLFEGTSLNTTFTLQACMDFEIKGLFFTLFSASFISILLLCYVIAPPYAAGHKLLLLLFLDEVVIAVGDSIRFVADGTGFMLDLERIGAKHDVFAGFAQFGGAGGTKHLYVLFGEHTIYHIIADACADGLVDCFNLILIEHTDGLTKAALVDGANLLHEDD